MLNPQVNIYTSIYIPNQIIVTKPRQGQAPQILYKHEIIKIINNK